MTVQEIFALIKDVKPGVWKIGVTYKKDLPLLKGRGKGPSPAVQAGINPGDIYKVVFRWCSANVNKKNTAAYQAAQAAAQQKAAAQGQAYQAKSSGFHASTNDEELNIIEYRDGTNDPCLILKKGPHADKIKYFNKGQEITLQDVQNLVSKKILSTTVLNELGANEVFYLYPDKVQSLSIDGQLHEEMGEDHMNEAMFNGISIQDADGVMGVEEELCEDRPLNMTGDMDVQKYYNPEDKIYADSKKDLANNDFEASRAKQKYANYTTAKDREARKYGYRNYAEYQSANK